MKNYKRAKPFISLVCAVALVLSMIVIAFAADGKSVTATAPQTIKQGSSGTCYVYIDSTEDLAALDVIVHFDPAKVKVTSVYNSISCKLYDSEKGTDSIQCRYLLDGEGSASQTRLFYFYYQVLSGAELGESWFDITIGEAYDSALNDVTVSGSRCKFTITETVTSKTCSVYSTSSLSTAVGQEFSLNYRFSTYQIASGSAVINYDPELFEVVSVTNGRFLDGKVTDVHTDLPGAVYVSFVGTQYGSYSDLLTVNFRTVKNVTETSSIVFKATELCDKDLNFISCSGYTTKVSVAFDSAYIGDAAQMRLDGVFSAEDGQVILTVNLEEDSRLGAGDFVITFDPELVSYNSCEQGFNPDFFIVNDKDVAQGQLKFYIINLADIVTEEKVLTVVFDVLPLEGRKIAEFTLDGTNLIDAQTERIMLRFVDTSVEVEQVQKPLAVRMDLNGDGKVSAFDAQMLAEAKADRRQMTEKQWSLLGDLTWKDIFDYILGRMPAEK